MSPLTWSVKRGMVIEAIKRALHETGETAFIESQNVIPVDTGALKESGNFQAVGDGIIIRYTKEYASSVERGWEGGRVWTRDYLRSDGVLVKGHYKNQSPREGRHFIEKSLRKFFVSGLSNKTPFQESIIIELKNGFVGNKVTEI